MSDKKTLRIVIVFAVVASMLYLLAPVLQPFLIAGLLAYLGNPLVERLETKGLSRSIAVTLVFVSMLLLLLVVLFFLVPRIGTQITILIEKLPSYVDWLKQIIQPWLSDILPAGNQLPDGEVLRTYLQAHWAQAGSLLYKGWESITASGQALFGLVASLMLVPVLSFYLLRDWQSIIRSSEKLLPRRLTTVWTRLTREADAVLGAFLLGQLWVMIALSFVYSIGLWLLGLDFALLIGLLAGFVSFVPYLGLVVGILVAGIAAILQFQGVAELPWVALVFVIGQLLEGVVLTPRLVGEQIGLHPVAVIFAVMAGAQLFGFTGVLLALPFAAVAMVLLRHGLGVYRSSEFYQGI